MTRGEIVAALIAFTVIGGFVVAACIHDLVVRELGALAVLQAGGIVFVLSGPAISYVQAIRELRRRR